MYIFQIMNCGDVWIIKAFLMRFYICVQLPGKPFSSVMKSVFLWQSVTPQLRNILQLCHYRVELIVMVLFNELVIPSYCPRDPVRWLTGSVALYY